MNDPRREERPADMYSDDLFASPVVEPGRPRAALVRMWTLLALLIGGLAWMIAARTAELRSARETPPAFARAVDLSPLKDVAVYYQGRLKSFHSFAFAAMKQVSGPHEVGGQDRAFTYLDMMLRPELYRGRDVVFVKSKIIRRLLADRVRQTPPDSGWPTLDEARLARFEQTGLMPSEVLAGHPGVHDLMSRLARDMVRSAKFVNQVEAALVLKQPTVLAARLAVLPPSGPDAGFHSPWTAVTALTADGTAGVSDGEPIPLQVGVPGAGALAGVNLDAAQSLVTAWADLVEGWRAEDAPRVNAALSTLGATLPTINPSLYPPGHRLEWEARYFDLGNMTWVWLVYMFGAIFLTASLIYQWPAARWLGVGTFLAAFLLHTAAVGLRWYVSGRWPNSNMFEAVTTAAWFGGACALFLEAIARRSPMRNLFFLTSAVASMAALMAADFLPLHLTPEIGNKMPILHDVWLYIHTNVIIFSYCLIAMAAVTAALYLINRVGGGSRDYARVGGAGSLMAGLDGRPGRRRASLSEVLDGATMLLMELSFVLLWAGTVMGAIWADHSWGRPWGWDPKEVFALATFVIFAMLIHVRMKVRDKGLWTAVLAILGAGVMIFNWTVINFVISGLHSYA